MEDKEREFYFQWITQCMQFNMQIMNNMMQMAMNNLVPRMPPMPMGMPSPLSPSLMPSQDELNKMMKSMFGLGKPDDKDLT